MNTDPDIMNKNPDINEPCPPDDLPDDFIPTNTHFVMGMKEMIKGETFDGDAFSYSPGMGFGGRPPHFSVKLHRMLMLLIAMNKLKRAKVAQLKREFGHEFDSQCKALCVFGILKYTRWKGYSLTCDVGDMTVYDVMCLLHRRDGIKPLPNPGKWQWLSPSGPYDGIKVAPTPRRMPKLKAFYDARLKADLELYKSTTIDDLS